MLGIPNSLASKLSPAFKGGLFISLYNINQHKCVMSIYLKYLIRKLLCDPELYVCDGILATLIMLHTLSSSLQNEGERSRRASLACVCVTHRSHESIEYYQTDTSPPDKLHDFYTGC